MVHEWVNRSKSSNVQRSVCLGSTAYQSFEWWQEGLRLHKSNTIETPCVVSSQCLLDVSKGNINLRGGGTKASTLLFPQHFGPTKTRTLTHCFFRQKHWVKFAYVSKSCTAIQKLVAIKASVTCARHSRQNCR